MRGVASAGGDLPPPALRATLSRAPAMPTALASSLSRRALVALVALALAGCAGARAHGRCARRGELRCLTPVVCSYDSRLDCETCRCSDVPYTPIAN